METIARAQFHRCSEDDFNHGTKSVHWHLVLAVLLLIGVPFGSTCAAVAAGIEPTGTTAPDPKKTELSVSYSGGLLAVSAKNADIRALFKDIGEKAELLVNLDPAISGTVTIEFKNSTVEAGCNKILEAFGEKNIAVVYGNKIEGRKRDIYKVSILRKEAAQKPTEEEVRAWIQKRDQEYRDLFERLNKEKNKIAKALKEYQDPATSEDKKGKLRTFLRQTPVKTPEDKLLLKGALVDPQYRVLRTDLQMALLHAIQMNPEESDKEYILGQFKRNDNNVGWLYSAMPIVWDDRYVPFLLEGAREGRLSDIEILGRRKIKEAIPVLEGLLLSNNPYIKDNALMSLRHITGVDYSTKNKESGKTDNTEMKGK